MDKQKVKYSWVETHKNLAKFLAEKQGHQKELIDLLKGVGIAVFNDKDSNGSTIELDEIDPFTFFCYIYKHGSKKRLEYLQKIAEKLKILPVPTDESGIPSSNAQQVWMFPYKIKRNNNEISRLWNLFFSALNYDITDDQFKDVLKIRCTGKTKLTEALFYVSPEKYFPINGPTKPYMQEKLGIESRFDTYSEYIEIIKKVKEKTNKPFYELSYEAWKYHNEEKTINYWVFQGNPDFFDFETGLTNNLIDNWNVSAHKDKIKKRDKVIIWLTGKNAGCYALAEVTQEPMEKEATSYNDHNLWKTEDKIKLKAGIKITHNFISNPIIKEQLENIDALSGLKVGSQGTNFSATKDEYLTLLEMGGTVESKQYWLYSPGNNADMWEEFYEQGIMGIGWDELGDLNDYKTKDEMTARLQEVESSTSSKIHDASANYNFKGIMSKGDIVIVKKGRDELLGYGEVTSDYYYDENRERFQKCRKVEWRKKGNWKIDFKLVVKTLTNITEYASDHPDYEYYYERLLGLMRDKKDYKKQEERRKDRKINFPRNTIFYGPPGTGKTYNTILRAAQIIENRSITDHSEAQEIFNYNLRERIEFITFHQSYSYEDFIQGLRPDVNNSDGLAFERKDGVFKNIATNALFEYYKASRKIKRTDAAEEKSDENEIYLDFVEHLKSLENKQFQTSSGSTIFISDFTKNNNIEFKHLNRSRSYLVSGERLLKLFSFFPQIEIIKNVHNDIKNKIGGCNTTVYWVALDEFIKFYNQHKSVNMKSSNEENYEEEGYESKIKLLSTVDLNDLRRVSEDSVKNYVIIIDEINRANISRVFGELITLIEDDKRSHGTIPLKCTLPSGEKFIVPSNLYIIGTMNTADKSIALLDIALRRRFDFEPMYPQYEIEGHTIHDSDVLEKMNEQIRESKGHDFQIGHSYFMGDNMDLAERMNKKVIPLLMEYFLNDEKEVIKIIKKAGLNVEKNSWPLTISEQK
ncbi:AAA family ATPase [Desulfobacterales bacterium HSG16]|nr:AAA family ATPase [Desulfobacterales bacterium HSG16]